MKKILFSLVALVCSMSMNAQVMKIMKGTTVVATYTADQADNVVFEEESAPTTGTAKRTGDIDVKWVQLWKNGPKFAEYNVGVTDGKAESYGGYYTWGDNDTATNLWGNAWRMPTQAELQALRTNCDVAWITVGDVDGYKFTGRADYKDNSVFLPAAGYRESGPVSGQGVVGRYWSSTPRSSKAYYLDFNSFNHDMSYDSRDFGHSVRAVLAE